MIVAVSFVTTTPERSSTQPAATPTIAEPVPAVANGPTAVTVDAMSAGASDEIWKEMSLTP